MSIYNLDLKQYKELKQKFKETVIGYRLYILFEICISLFIFGIVINLFGVIFDGITNGQYGDVLFSDTLLYVAAICSFLSYSLFFNNLKKFHDERKK